MSVPARRRQVAYGRERGLSVRRACTLFSVARSALRYRGRKATKDAAAIGRMRELSAQYPRYGYRRIRIFLGLDGHRMSVGRTTGCGDQRGCRCRASGPESASRLLGHDRGRRADRTRCGPTTLCSIDAPTASNSNV